MGCREPISGNRLGKKSENNRFESLPFSTICEKSLRCMMPKQRDWLKMELDFLFRGGNGALVMHRKQKK